MDEMTKKLIELYEQNIALLKENHELKLKLANNSTTQIIGLNINPLGQLPLIGTINTPYISHGGEFETTATDLRFPMTGIPHVG
jgi:hypothetical protein